MYCADVSAPGGGRRRQQRVTAAITTDGAQTRRHRRTIRRPAPAHRHTSAHAHSPHSDTHLWHPRPAGRGLASRCPAAALALRAGGPVQHALEHRRTAVPVLAAPATGAQSGRWPGRAGTPTSRAPPAARSGLPRRGAVRRAGRLYRERRWARQPEARDGAAGSRGSTRQTPGSSEMCAVHRGPARTGRRSHSG